MRNLPKILILLHKMSRMNTVRLKGLNSKIEELKIEQQIRHRRIMRSTEENLEKDLKLYLFNNNSLNQSEDIIDKIEEIKKDNLMIIELFMKYSNMPEASSMVIDMQEYLSRKNKVDTLYTIFNDLEEEENYEYVKMIRDKINTLENNSILPNELN